MAYRLGIDVGGTFTDLLLFDEATGRTYLAKTLCTPADLSAGVMAGIAQICRKASISPGEVATILHGTTVATNAILERKGARVGLLITEGFEQVLHLARSQTPGPLAGWMIMIKPDPLASLEDTRGVRERMDPRGRVVRALDEEELREALEGLRRQGVESLAVSLLHAYANPAHEERVREVAAGCSPELPATLSSEILPEFREYERTQTAVVNAYIKPPVRRYLSGLQGKLREAGHSATINVLRSDGGLMTVEGACERPVYAVLSGPSGGVSGALFVARAAGFQDILTLDMGGTSTDVSLCLGGQPTLQRETQLGYHVVRAPAIDVRSVGAGGGSIASVPALTRALRVGPQSAGADPGPACYGRGGQEATVTDAHLVLGHLPSELLGGEMPLDVDAAHRAVERVGQALGMDVLRAAEGIVAVANEHMFGALRLVSVERGYDARNFALVAFGGAGPIHANFLARLLGSWPVLVPPSPGLLCALGNLCSDFRNEFARTFVRRLDELGDGELGGVLRTLGEEARRWLTREGIGADRQEIRYHVDLRYYRQGLEVSLEVDPAGLSGDGVGELARRFGEAHEQLYRFKLDAPCEVVNVRAVGIGRTRQLELPRVADGPKDLSEAIAEVRRIYHGGHFLEAAVYARSRLGHGSRLEGPAIVTEMDSTTLILPGDVGEVDPWGNIFIRPL